ncbi:MAG: DUF4199 domain-containing protein [Chitinophagaceae bacterium]
MNSKVSHFLAGLIIGCVLILFNVILIIFNQTGNTNYSWIGSAILIVSINYFIIENSKTNNFKKTFGELFTYGFKSSAIITLILTAFMIIYTIIFPDSIEKTIITAREQMESKKDLSEDQIEVALTFTRKFYLPFLIGGTIFSTILIGAVGSLIGAAIANKKNSNSPFEN